MAVKEKTDTNNISFEQALAKLENIVKQLESGDTPLEASIAMFEEGIKLTSYCNNILNTAEQKVTALVKLPNGELAEEAFNKNE